MAKKELQAEINENCMTGLALFDEAAIVNRGKLYRCKAETLELSNDCLALISHGSLVAVFDRLTGCFYDVLRYTYGYNRTSARHIAKFRSALCKSILKEFTYYHI